MKKNWGSVPALETNTHPVGGRTVRALGNASGGLALSQGKSSPLTLENAKVTFGQQEKTSVGKQEL